MRSLKISVVIPTYRRPDLLLRCVQSLIDQAFDARNFEIIIISDGDDDATSNAITSLAPNRNPVVRYYPLPHKAGPAAARNLGWILAEAPLIAFTNDDCFADEQWLKSLWFAYEERKMREIAFSGATIVPIRKQPTDYEQNVSHLASAEFIAANCACSKDALLRVGGFDERFKMAWREDSDLQFKLIDGGIPVIRVHDAMITHPVRKAPWGICIKEERKGMFNALLYKKFPQLYAEKIQPALPWHYYGSVAFLLMLLTGLILGAPAMQVAGFAGWLAITGWFAWRRLRTTSRAWSHVCEMVFTSAVIPALSLFWQFYGSWKYKVLLIR
jgi:glycosyltransferase involved in cell wall biosynthesis